MNSKVQQEEIVLYPVETLATLAQWGAGAMIWEFPTHDMAVRHLRAYEKFFSGWAFNFHFSLFSVRSLMPEKEWTYPSAEQPGLMPEGGIFFTPKTDEDEFDYVQTCEQRLTTPVLEVMTQMSRSPGIKGIVKWETQKQVVLTRDCSAIPIGTTLPMCFEYERLRYWYRPDYDRFLQHCRDDLREDGTNTITHDYLTFDPTNGGDWIRVWTTYRMLNAGRLGYYQIAEGLRHEAALAP